MTTGDLTAPASLSHEGPPGPEQLAVAASVFRLLSDPTRLHLLWTLAHGEVDVTTLTEASGASRTAVSQHLAKLRLAGLVEARKESRRSVYRLRDGHLRRLVLEALNHADHTVTGEPPHA
ncbi:ArsR/SmtB family transcription factor [Marinitenerispora sediminis]|uniref:ArsR/SmtB family transcription factor n=1 Tax=Marinitenerispora sediminis TaxID=1931232 RepID=UPI000DF23894|nr:metalloregulator ArsR/SmtB family transcription factor [Marinitenerispora sediminis]RCV52057.1 transcriptional regulator [Marinitenerispora sediminis]RCV58076.1 transcriptional regulator [Marinitenerispora sediminis]